MMQVIATISDGSTEVKIVTLDEFGTLQNDTIIEALEKAHAKVSGYVDESEKVTPDTQIINIKREPIESYRKLSYYNQPQ